MDPLFVLVIVVGAAVLIVMFVREQRTWREFHAAPGYRPESAARLHSRLRDAGIRTRYKVVGMGGPGMGSGANQTVKVLVHREDYERARAVQAGMERER